MIKLQRNNKCPCGSGKKYKKCCLLDPWQRKNFSRAANLSNTWEEMAEILATPIPVYRLKITLKEMWCVSIKEEVSRTCEIAGDDSLFNLHVLIQKMFGWDNDHLYSFYLGTGEGWEDQYSGDPAGGSINYTWGILAQSAYKTQIRDIGLIEKLKFRYLFDFGDNLEHDILVEKTRTKTDDDKLPRQISQIGEAPKQYGEC